MSSEYEIKITNHKELSERGSFHVPKEGSMQASHKADYFWNSNGQKECPGPFGRMLRGYPHSVIVGFWNEWILNIGIHVMMLANRVFCLCISWCSALPIQPLMKSRQSWAWQQSHFQASTETIRRMWLILELASSRRARILNFDNKLTFKKIFWMCSSCRKESRFIMEVVVYYIKRWFHWLLSLGERENEKESKVERNREKEKESHRSVWKDDMRSSMLMRGTNEKSRKKRPMRGGFYI